MAEYKLPERVASMTVHHTYGITKPGEQKTIRDYLKVHSFALVGDLLAQNFSPADIETVVNSEEVAVAHWPAEKPVTDMYWAKDEATLQKLEELAATAVACCHGQTPDQPVGGTFITIGAEMGSQQMALVGLIYARAQGKVREIPELGSEDTGPLYVARGGFSDEMFEKFLPSKK